MQRCIFFFFLLFIFKLFVNKIFLAEFYYKDSDMKIVIIGGGPCGLGAAWRTEEVRRQG
jgi:ribulose 1,5-bisphosphate synthetase/thiazole synthase